MQAVSVSVFVLQHFPDLSAVFDKMRVSLDNDTTLVPPDFLSWIGNFSLYTSFNYTKYDIMVRDFIFISPPPPPPPFPPCLIFFQ